MCIPERGKMNPVSLALKILADQKRSAFKEKNFELKRKKMYLGYLPLPLYQIQALHWSQRKKHFISWRVGERLALELPCGRFCRYKTCTIVPHNVEHHFWISLVKYLQKSLITVSLRLISNSVFFHVTELGRHYTGKKVGLPHSFSHPLLYRVILL